LGFYPHPGYVAYNNLARTLRGKRFDRQFELSDGQWVFGFRGEGAYVLVSWAQERSDEAELLVESDAETATRIDLMGNRTRPRQADGKARTQIAELPGYLVLEGTEQAPSVEAR